MHIKIRLGILIKLWPLLKHSIGKQAKALVTTGKIKWVSIDNCRQFLSRLLPWTMHKTF